MSKKSVVRVAQRAKTQDAKIRKASTNDSFQNFVARVGLGANNQLSAGRYSADYWTRNRTELEFAYRTSWVVGKAVDAPAEDMTRAGIEIKSVMDPLAIEKLQRAMMKQNIWTALCDTIRWARLFGGAIAVMMIDGQDVSTPLRLDSIKKGQFKGLQVLDRWLLQPSLNDLVTEMNPDIGKPRFYSVVADAQYLASMRIHYSRVLRIDGIDLPYYQRLTENLWGESVMERMHDRLVAFDSATMGAAQLMFKAHLRTLSVENLRELIAAGGNAFEALLQQINMQAKFQSNEGITLLDAKDKFETHQYSFAGIPDTLLQLAQQLAGALDVPMVRLFGMSPAGLNATGESDLKTYYENINRQQEAKLRRPLSNLLDVMIRSVNGTPPEEDFHFIFRTLKQLDEIEKSDIANKDSESVGSAFDRGIISQATALKELKQSSQVSGRFSNITDEDINDADVKPPAAASAMEGQGSGENEEGETV